MLAWTARPLFLQELPVPIPKDDQVLVKVEACGICRTDLHVIDGELPAPKNPVILGHQIVGRVVQAGAKVTNLSVGDLVGIPWLGWTCSHCRFCLEGKENLCEKALFNGYTIDGGFAEYTVAFADYCYKLPEEDPVQMAPLLCAGLIGFRAYRKLGKAKKIGFLGFGSSAHLLTQLASQEERQVFAFVRPGDNQAKDLAISLGAVWAGSSLETPDVKLDGVIVFASLGELVVKGLSLICPGGVVCCAGIHMSDIPSFPYSLLFGEKEIVSISHLTREDGRLFFEAVKTHPINPKVTVYPFDRLPEAVDALREGHVSGSLVLRLE